MIRGGYNVYPREIEEVLFAHPGIREAAVIGKPDDRLGEEVVAVVVLARRRQPRRAGDHRATAGNGWPPTSTRARSGSARELPKGPTGKILKTELRG